MYGYKTVNGKIIINENEAEIIRNIFDNYLSGKSLRGSALLAGVSMNHCSVKNIIRRTCYTGNDFYPAIIDKQDFAKANAELIRRSAKHSSVKRVKTQVVYTDFVMETPALNYDDPIKQAEYLYSLIEVRK